MGPAGQPARRPTLWRHSRRPVVARRDNGELRLRVHPFRREAGARDARCGVTIRIGVGRVRESASLVPDEEGERRSPGSGN